jgi:hypothetical protein
MALGTPTYPTSLDTAATLGPTSGIVAGTTPLNAVGTNQGDQLGITNNLINTMIGVETLVGITNSTTTTTHEYRIRRYPFAQWPAGMNFIQPATSYATFSAQANGTPYLNFPTGSINTATFMGLIPWGAVLTSGLTVRLSWSAPVGTTGNVAWGAAMERFGVTAVTTDSFDTQGITITAVNGTINIWTSTVITLTNIDSCVAGDWFRLQIQRKTTSDTSGQAAQLYAVSVEVAA